MAIQDRPVVNTDYPVLEKVADMAIKEKQKFERLVVPKETLLEMFGVRASDLGFVAYADVLYSTTSTRSISLRPRFLTARPRLSTAAGPWSTCVSAPTSRTQAA